jgi:hypothetical protein
MNSVTSYAEQPGVHDVLARKSVHDVVALNNYDILTSNGNHHFYSILKIRDKVLYVRNAPKISLPILGQINLESMTFNQSKIA